MATLLTSLLGGAEVSGFSGYSGRSGFSGYSGVSGLGLSGYSGIGTSGYSGIGTSGYSGIGIPKLNIVSGTTQAAIANNQYVLTNVAASTVTLPASPLAGDVVWVTVGNNLTTNVIARNGNNIMGLAENMTLDNANMNVQLMYINSTLGWRMM